MSTPDLNRMRVFLHVYRHCSVLEASKELHVTQSAVSQSLKALETEIDTPLFQRLNKTLIPTEAAQQLATVMEPFLASLDDKIHTLQKAKSKPVGRLRIGAPTGTGFQQLIQLFVKFQKEYPDVTFELKLGSPGRLLHYLVTHEVDFALVDEIQALEKHPVTVRPLFDLPFFLIGTKAFVQKHLKTDHSFEALEHLPFITYFPNGYFVRMWFTHHFGKAPEKIHSVLTVNNVQAVVEAVKNNMGLGVIPEFSVTEELKSGRLVHVETKKKPMINRVMLVKLLGRFQTVAETSFTEFLKRPENWQRS